MAAYITALLGWNSISHPIVRKDQPLAKNGRLPPYLVPEVLENILAYLGNDHLMFTASQVCKLWHTVAHRHIIRPTRLTIQRHPDRSVTTKPAKAIALRLKSTQELHFNTYYGNNPTNSDCLEAWRNQERQLFRDVKQSIKTLTALERDMIQRVIVEGVEALKYNFMDTFADLHSLRVLRLQDVPAKPLQLSILLQSFPLLEELTIALEKQYGMDDIGAIMRYGVYLPSLGDIGKEHPYGRSLRSLHLKNAVIDLKMLSAFLSHCCPRLESLALVGHDGMVRGSTQRFMQEIAQGCPRLCSLGWSVYTTDSQRSLHDDYVYLFTTFSAMASWRVPDRGFEMINERVWVELQPHMDRLTTLNLVSDYGKCCIDTRKLHAYLCRAPQLQHLYASSVFFQASQWDVSQGSCKLWACRRLRTLHLSFQAFTQRGMSIDRGNKGTRQIFAYVAKVCPDLEDVLFRYSDFRLELNAGLCLLSELRRLRKLVVFTKSPYDVQEQDLVWMATRDNPSLLTLKSLAAFLHIYEDSKVQNSSVVDGKVEIGGKEKEEEEEDEDEAEKEEEEANMAEYENAEDAALVVSIRAYQKLSAVRSVLKQLARQSEGVMCWPHLEVLWLRPLYIYSRTLHEKALVAELRPSLRFQQPPTVWSRTDSNTY